MAAWYPTRISVVDWKADRDLRRTRRDAGRLTAGLKPGEAVLVTNRYLFTVAERFHIVVKGARGGAWVLTPPARGNVLLGLFTKLHATLAEFSRG